MSPLDRARQALQADSIDKTLMVRRSSMCSPDSAWPRSFWTIAAQCASVLYGLGCCSSFHITHLGVFLAPPSPMSLVCTGGTAG